MLCAVGRRLYPRYLIDLVEICRQGAGLLRGTMNNAEYPESSLIRSSPPQCFASVFSPRDFRHLCFSLHEATGSCSSAKKPASASRPLYAGRRLPSHQALDRLVPERPYASGFDAVWIFNDACSVGSLSFVSPTHTYSRCFPELGSNAHHHGSLPQRLGVRSAPENRSRGACPHLFRSFST